jgi:hypothetical protein
VRRFVPFATVLLVIVAGTPAQADPTPPETFGPEGGRRGRRPGHGIPGSVNDSVVDVTANAEDTGGGGVARRRRANWTTRPGRNWLSLSASSNHTVGR